MKTSRLVVALLATLLTAIHADAEETGLRFESGENRVELIELYTSEGCNSCPPADRWLSRLKTHDRLWTDFAPVAFHVDYWDYIGWKDRFAKSEYSNRQRRYALEGGARTVYTPGVFKNGIAWHGWRRGKLDRGPLEKPGNLTVTIDGDAVRIRFDPTMTRTNPELTAHVVELGMDLSTRVEAGENAGKTLQHDFVALNLHSLRLNRNEAGYSGTLTLQALSSDAPGSALVAWVSTSETQAPLQAAGGFLVPPPQ